jgi:ribosomal protein S18 acetylase RimI-like enzyme
MDFYIDTSDPPAIGNQEISELLSRVYVEGGFTDPERAAIQFEPSAVRNRGRLICARREDGLLAGMVILVLPGSLARILAEGDEAEIHLLGVKPEFRGKGLGRRVVTAALELAKAGGHSKLLLCTQIGMKSAHRLYESLGFIRVPDRDFNRGGRDFLVYEILLSEPRENGGDLSPRNSPKTI